MKILCGLGVLILLVPWITVGFIVGFTYWGFMAGIKGADMLIKFLLSAESGA